MMDPVQFAYQAGSGAEDQKSSFWILSTNIRKPPTPQPDYCLPTSNQHLTPSSHTAWQRNSSPASICIISLACGLYTFWLTGHRRYWSTTLFQTSVTFQWVCHKGVSTPRILYRDDGRYPAKLSLVEIHRWHSHLVSTFGLHSASQLNSAGVCQTVWNLLSRTEHRKN